MKTKWPSFVVPVLLAVTTAASAAAEPTEFELGKAEWQQKRYASAVAHLLRARAMPNGKTPETDYMLGVAGCKIPGREAWGQRYLNWALKTYSLDPPSHKLVAQELDRCKRGVASSSPDTGISEIVAAQAPPGASGSGKVMDLGEKLIASRPARQLRKLTSDEVAERRVPVGNSEAVVAMVKKVSGLGNVAVCDDLVVATDLSSSSETMQRVCGELLHFRRFLRRYYALTPPAVYTVVYLIDDRRKMSSLAESVHKLQLDRRTLGYTVHDDSSVVTLAPALGLGTAQHELFHLLARVDFGDIPQWFDEGIAAVYEVSRRCGDSYYGVTNWRAKVMKDFGAADVRTLVLATWYPFDEPAEHGGEGPSPSARRYAQDMATARYFAIYLQEKRQLGAVFAGLRDRDPASTGDPGEAAVALLERVLEKPMPAIQQDFEAWYQKSGRTLQYSSQKCATSSLGAAAEPPRAIAFDPGPVGAAVELTALTPAAAPAAPGPTPPPAPMVSPGPPPAPPSNGCACELAKRSPSPGRFTAALALLAMLGARRLRRTSITQG
jgi:hypothetical protein